MRNDARLGVAVWLALAGCGGPVKVSGTQTRAEPTSAPEAAADPGAPCGNGLEVVGTVDVVAGSPAFFYEDRTSLAWSAGGAAYAYLDHDTQAVSVARLDAAANKRSVRTIEFSDKHERSHVVAAFRGEAGVVATAVYHADQEADIELVMLDGEDRRVWTTRVDPSPEFDGDPAVVWSGDEIAVVWARGTYPGHDRLRLAVVDPKTGAVKGARELFAGQNVGVPVIAGDGAAYWVAWETDVYRGGGISIVRATAARNLGTTTIAGGANPSLLATKEGVAVAYDDDRAIWFTRLDAEGKQIRASERVQTHPDPIGQPRKPVLAFDGRSFAVAYEVTFHASVMVARQSEARLAILGPDGAASPSIVLHPEASAGEMPAVAWTGKDWLVVFNRDRLMKGKTPQVVASRVACRAESRPRTVVTAGPCDARTVEVSKELRTTRERIPAAVLRGEDGGYAAIELQLESRALAFVRVGADGATRRVTLATGDELSSPTLTQRPGGFAAGWIDGEGPPVVALLGESGAPVTTVKLPGKAVAAGRPGLAWTPKGLVVAYARGKEVVTRVVDAAGKVQGAETVVTKPPFPAYDCALGHGPRGLLLAFASGSDISETSVVRAMRLGDAGEAAGPLQLVTAPRGFRKDPVVVGAAEGFLLLTTGPFGREVVGVELGANGEALRPERNLLDSYGFAGFGGAVAGTETVVFGLEEEKLQERRVCP